MVLLFSWTPKGVPYNNSLVEAVQRQEKLQLTWFGKPQILPTPKRGT